MRFDQIAKELNWMAKKGAPPEALALYIKTKQMGWPEHKKLALKLHLQKGGKFAQVLQAEKTAPKGS